MTAFEIWSATAVALFLKMFGVALVQAFHRVKYGAFVRPEDASYWANGPAQSKELPIVQRAQNVLNNDGENIPIFLFLGLAHVQLGGEPEVVWVLMATFVASRIVHTLAYLFPKQPLRNRAHLLGLTVMFVQSGLIISAIVR